MVSNTPDNDAPTWVLIVLSLGVKNSISPVQFSFVNNFWVASNYSSFESLSFGIRPYFKIRGKKWYVLTRTLHPQKSAAWCDEIHRQLVDHAFCWSISVHSEQSHININFTAWGGKFCSGMTMHLVKVDFVNLDRRNERLRYGGATHCNRSISRKTGIFNVTANIGQLHARTYIREATAYHPVESSESGSGIKPSAQGSASPPKVDSSKTSAGDFQCTVKKKLEKYGRIQRHRRHIDVVRLTERVGRFQFSLT